MLGGVSSFHHNGVNIEARRVLELLGICKSYRDENGPLPILRSLDFTLGRGDSCALTGESGSGKSTLLHLIAGLDRPEAGTIRINALDLGTLSEAALNRLRRQTVGMVFQQFHLLPTLTVRDNIRFVAALNHSENLDLEHHLIKTLNLSPLLSRYPEQLSGGQQQRVAIARALLPKPALVLADEPTGSLDEAHSSAVIELLLDLCRATGTSLLLATHSEQIAARLQRRVHLRQGQLHDSADLTRPASSH